MPDLDMPAPRPVAQGRRTLPFAGLPIGRHGGDAAGGVVGGVAGAGNWFLASSLGAGGGSSTSTQISMAMPTGNVGIVQASPYSSPMLATEGVAEGGAAAPLVANSIKCGETGRIFERQGGGRGGEGAEGGGGLLGGYPSVVTAVVANGRGGTDLSGELMESMVRIETDGDMARAISSSEREVRERERER